MRRVWIASMALLAFAAQAQWLDSEQAKEFRERVIQLALLYGESSGIDLQGYKVETREVKKLGDVCGYVEVVTSKEGKEVRRETVRACKAR
jgi:hypothetical protein